MGVMVDILSEKIRDMKDLRQREQRRDNKVAQDALDFRFKALTTQIHSLMVALRYTKENVQFQLSDALLSDLENLLMEQKAVIQSGFVEKYVLEQAENDLKNCQQGIKKEWLKQYSILTNATISTLQAISGIASEHVDMCMAGIAKGSVWTTNIGDFKTMNRSLSEAETLIDGLGMDQQIIAFLQKMNNGKATLMDLDDNVLHWLKGESLDKRVKLSFIGSRK